MAYSVMMPVVAGLAIGLGFMILIAISLAAQPTDSLDFLTSAKSRIQMPASYYLKGCDLSSSLDQQFAQESYNSAVETASITSNIQERNWISVVRADRAMEFGSGIDSPCTRVTNELASQLPFLERAMTGADGCINGTEVCQVAYMISRGGDDADYELTITREGAEAMLKKVKLGQYNAAILAKGNNFYLMQFHSNGDEEFDDAQVEAQFLNFSQSYEPIHLKAGESVNYTLLVNTWATYGHPAKIELIASPSARDSGLIAKFDPPILEMEERTQAEATLTISATQAVRDGRYDISVGGKVNNIGYFPMRGCEFSCIDVMIGDNDWKIQTFGSDTGIGQYGLGKSPEILYLDLQTDKETYPVGEPIQISTHIVNDGPEAIILNGTDSNRRLVVTISGPIDESGNIPGSVYLVDAYDFDATDPIILEPRSTMLVVRSFVWDQMTMAWGVEPHQVPDGTYSIGVSFAGYSNAVLDAHSEVTIKD